MEWIWEANGDNLIVDGMGFLTAAMAGHVGGEVTDTFYTMIVRKTPKVSSQ